MPISLMAVIMAMNFSTRFEEVSALCNLRDVCLSYCMSDNFPQLTCEQFESNIVYNGNAYTKFFNYPNPTKTNANE